MTPSGRPPVYVDIAMPDRFVLEVPARDGGWIEHGRFAAEHFARQPDGGYVCSGHGGSPMFLRCLAQRNDLVDVVDGEGARHTYRLVPLPDERQRPTAG